MCGYFKDNGSMDPSLQPKLVRRIFELHRKLLKQQGAVSRLRYVGIGTTVYACMWPPGLKLHEVTPTRPAERSLMLESDANAEFELVELEKEEADSFDFIRTLKHLPRW